MCTSPPCHSIGLLFDSVILHFELHYQTVSHTPCEHDMDKFNGDGDLNKTLRLKEFENPTHYQKFHSSSAITALNTLRLQTEKITVHRRLEDIINITFPVGTTERKLFSNTLSSLFSASLLLLHSWRHVSLCSSFHIFTIVFPIAVL